MSKFRKNSVGSAELFCKNFNLFIPRQNFVNLNAKIRTDFATVSKCLFSLILVNVKFSLLIGLKSNNLVFNSFRESLFALS